jgi:uncharacterized protein YjbI with pentapeptide repeats
MPTRRAFARPGLLPALAAAFAGSVALARVGRSYRCRQACLPALRQLGIGRLEYLALAPCPRFNIPLAGGRKVSLTDLRPGMAFDDGCYLRGVDLGGMNLAEVKIVKADLSAANLRRALLRRAILTETKLNRALLPYADFSGADLRSTCLSGATLWATNLAGADLRGADLSGIEPCMDYAAPITSLHYFDWEEHLTIRGAHYDRFTRWPAGFRPEEHGARLVE